MEYTRDKGWNSVQKIQTEARLIMTSLSVVTTFPPNRWTAYAKRMLESHIAFWPEDVVLHAYYEKVKPKLEHPKINFVDIEDANPELVKFKNRHKDDPV